MVQPVSARVVDIVNDGGDEAGGLVYLVAVLLHSGPVEEAGRGVEDVGRVRRVVVRVAVVVGLEQRQPVLGGNSIGFLDRQTDRLKMGDGLKMSDFGLGMS